MFWLGIEGTGRPEDPGHPMFLYYWGEVGRPVETGYPMFWLWKGGTERPVNTGRPTHIARLTEPRHRR